MSRNLHFLVLTNEITKKVSKGVRKDIEKNKKGIFGRPFWEERFLGMLDLCGFPAPGNCFWEVEFGTLPEAEDEKV